MVLINPWDEQVARDVRDREVRVLKPCRQKNVSLFAVYVNAREPGTHLFAAGFPDPVSSRAKPALSLRLCPLDEGVRENPAAFRWGMAMEVGA